MFKLPPARPLAGLRARLPSRQPTGPIFRDGAYKIISFGLNSGSPLSETEEQGSG